MAFSLNGAVAGAGGLMVAFSSCRKDTISCLTIVCTSKKEKEAGAGAGVLGEEGVVAPQDPLAVPRGGGGSSPHPLQQEELFVQAAWYFFVQPS